MLAGAPLLRELGTVVCHLPQRVSAPSARLLRAVAANNELVVIAGLTGVPKADATVVASLARLGTDPDADGAIAVVPVHGTAVCTVSDADDEVLAVVRGIVDAMREGVPLERMAVLIGNTEPYRGCCTSTSRWPHIAHNGVSVRTLADSVLGRSLLRMLALPDDNFRREDVFALLASVPVLDGHGRPAPAVEWERTSRDAGVVGGVAEWSARLEHYARGLEGAGDEEGERRAAYRRDRAPRGSRGSSRSSPTTWTARRARGRSLPSGRTA